MKKLKVRVTIEQPDCCPDGEMRKFIECLRYAGLLHVVTEEDNLLIIDLLPPAGIVARVWAEQNCARMKSFGYKTEIVKL